MAEQGTHNPTGSGTGFISVAQNSAKLASQADGWDPTTVAFASSRKLPWRCPEGHHFIATPGNRRRFPDGCPVCCGRQVRVGETDLATTHPALAAEADGWDPTTVTRGSDTKRTWRCSAHGHTWDASPCSRTHMGSGCPTCAGRRVLAGFNDLATTHPLLAVEADGWDPTTVVAGSNSKRTWQCRAHGHTWESAPITRTNMGSGCPTCAGRRVLAGFNDLATTHPDLAPEAQGWDPTTVVAGSAMKRTWRCRENGHTWVTAISHRALSGTGCPTCASSGYRKSRPAWLYLMERPGEQQIGITNNPKARLSTHRGQGWVLKDLVGPIDGTMAYERELAVKRYLRSQGLCLPGTRENWSSARVHVDTLVSLEDLAQATVCG